MCAVLGCGGGDNTNRDESDSMRVVPPQNTMPMDDTSALDSLDSLEGPLRP